MQTTKTYINWTLSDDKKVSSIDAKGSNTDLLCGLRSIFNNYVIELAKEFDAKPEAALNFALDFLLEDKNLDAVIQAIKEAV